MLLFLSLLWCLCIASPLVVVIAVTVAVAVTVVRDTVSPLFSSFGVQGVCKILCSYWRALPKDVIQSWFTILLTKLAADASSPQVRQQVVKVRGRGW